MGLAFCEYIETRPDSTIPHTGVAATVVVTMTLDALFGGLAAAALAAAALDTGTRISTAEARRLACAAGIIPAVLGSTSRVLDLGRKTRLHTEPLMHHPGPPQPRLHRRGACDTPPGLCHAHHDHPWHQGGNTGTKTGRLLCPRHHTLAHHPDNTTAHGELRFIKRT